MKLSDLLKKGFKITLFSKRLTGKRNVYKSKYSSGARKTKSNEEIQQRGEENEKEER